jgi:ABC-type sugar transport system substrate-binding protein
MTNSNKYSGGLEMKKNLALAMTLVLIILTLVGCGTASATTTQSSTAAQAGAPAESGSQLLVKDGKPVSVVYISNENASNWQAIGTGYLKTLIEKQGGTCQIFNPENDSQKQAQMVEDALVLNPDVLVIKPIDAVGIVPTLNKVNEAGIPIIALDTGVSGDVKLLTHIQTDQYSLGSINAEYVSKVSTDYGRDAQVVSILGDITSTIAQDRQKGFNETAEKAGNVKVLAETECKWDPNAAYSATLDMFTRFPEANTVFIQADCMQSGVMQALNELIALCLSVRMVM